MYKYNEKLKTKAEFIKSKLQKSLTLPVAFIFLLTPLSVLAKAGVDNPPVTTTPVASYYVSVAGEIILTAT